MIMSSLFLFMVLILQQYAIANSLDIYEYKDKNGVTVFTNNIKDPQIKGASKLAPLVATQIYSDLAINSPHQNSHKKNSYQESTVYLNNKIRQQILQQEYDKELAQLNQNKKKLAELTDNKYDVLSVNSQNNSEISKLSTAIKQHQENIELLTAQLHEIRIKS